MKDAVGSVKDRVMGSPDDDYDRGAVGTVTDKAYAAKDTVSGKASEAGEAVREAPATVKRKAQGNPLAAGVIAFGLGMLVSSLIPSSEKERQAVSQLQENLGPVKEKATALARDVGDSLMTAAQQAAESVKTSAQEGVESVKQEGQAAAQDVKDQAQESKETVQQRTS